MAENIENVNNEFHSFTKEQIKRFMDSKQDFLNGKTTAIDWTAIEKDLNNTFDADLVDESL